MHVAFCKERFDFPDLNLVRNRMCRQSLARLQVYWVDCKLRERSASALFGPEWLQQKHKAAIAQSLGIQRFGTMSKHNPESLFPDDMSKEMHVLHALTLQSPFLQDIPLDEDALFACR